MSHRWDCPTSWEARREGERAFERGDASWRNPYREDDECPDACRAWDVGYRAAHCREEERREEEAARERRRFERQREEDRWREAEEAEYEARCAEEEREREYVEARCAEDGHAYHGETTDGAPTCVCMNGPTLPGPLQGCNECGKTRVACECVPW